MDRSLTIGVIFGNRDFFPDHLVLEARADIEKLAADFGLTTVMLSPENTKMGGVETFAEAQKCADLFARHRGDIAGVLVCLPNFGDEKGVADTLKLAGLGVPVLIQAYPDQPNRMTPDQRRDAYCGKISVANNLYQAGIPYTLTRRHVCHPDSEAFRSDFSEFLSVCRVVRGMKGVRLGAVGARPGAFNTVRYSEKILERHGISVTTVDLSELFGRMGRLDDTSPSVTAKLETIRDYAPTKDVPAERLVSMAKLGVVLTDWMDANAIDATAIQCWTSVQQNVGCNVCTLMSMMSERFMPSACEVDVTGVLTMWAMQLAAGKPAALVDWNNNYGDDPDRCVLFHCGNWAKSFLPDIEVANAPILGSTLGVENTWGALKGRTTAGPLTFGRISTDDAEGRVKAYFGEGELTNDPLNTFGTRAVAHVPDLDRLMRHICKNGFEHHAVMTQSRTARVLREALGTYLRFDVHVHGDME